MNLEERFFDNNLFTAIRLGFWMHNLIVFNRKAKKYNLKAFAQIVAQ